MQVLTNKEIHTLATATAKQILNDRFGILRAIPPPVAAYPVPRGGIPAAYAIQAVYGHSMTIVDDPNDADIIIDDIVDSGSTLERFNKEFPAKRFYSLVNKLSTFDQRTGIIVRSEFKAKWIVFPWEGTAESGIEDNILRLLQYVGEDPKREGLLETPARVAKAWKQWCSGYTMKPEEVLKTFKDGADGCDEMVIQKDIPFYSHCEHHLAPFFGTATIAYVPNGKIVGLSKLARLLDIFSRRLQVQERLTGQVADAMVTHLMPKGVGVVLKARHLCIESRGVDKQGHYTVTSALRGVLKDKPEARAEFMSLAGAK